MGPRAWDSDRRSILLKPPVPRLHAVTDDRVLALDDFLTRVSAIGPAGPIALHLRARGCPARERLRLAGLLRGAGMLFVNDRVDVAVSARAQGIHLPSSGLPVAVTREMVGPSMLIGRSTHSAAEALAADAEGADYVFLGPIWETPSHPDTPGLGISAIRESSEARVIAIGGITPERIGACLDAGAWGVAAISALWLAEDVATAAETFLLSFVR